MPFSSAPASLRRTLATRGFVTPTPVQAAIMAPDVEVRDVLVSAQTGSGKTVAFGLALARTLLGDTERFGAAGAPRALIVTPTRELAMQVHRELSWLYAETGARITTCVGGMDPRRESHALGHGVHIVVGTPGRLCDHLERRSLVLDRLAAVVLDEADEMLDMGFREDLERLLDAAPKERRTLMFSATIPKPIATLAKHYQRDALRIATSGEGDRHRDIEYQVVSIVPRERDLAVVNLLRFHDAPGALVFCGTRDGVTHLAANLSERGFSVAALSGELSQRERNQALQALRDGRARVCVATDVAARGLDLPDLGLVIHADLPQNKEMLVHRSGRTGRAGKKGLAIVLAVDAARRFVERLLYSARVEAAWRLPPSSEDIRRRDQDHLVAEIQTLTAEIADADREVARTLLADRSAEDLVAALVRLRREARPEPEELTIPASMRQRTPADRRPSGAGDRRQYERPAPAEHRYTAVRGAGGPQHERPAFARSRGPAPGGVGDRPAHEGHASSDRRASAPHGVGDRPAHEGDARSDRRASAPHGASDRSPHEGDARSDRRASAPHGASDRSPHEGDARSDRRASVPHAAGDQPQHAPPATVEHRVLAPDGAGDQRQHERAASDGGDHPPHERSEPRVLVPDGAGDPPQHARPAPDGAGDPPQHARPAPDGAGDPPQHARPAPDDAGDQPQHSRPAPDGAGDQPQHARPAPDGAGDQPQHARPARNGAGDQRPERRAPATRGAGDRPQHERTVRPPFGGGGHDGPPAARKHPRQPAGDDARKLVWFTINIGRSKNADPKWLIPLLCRRGGITKSAIGAIQILARETRVEIAHDVSERFAAAVREPDTKDRNIHIEPLDVAI